ncbi:hypothetical protein pipiens_012005 [Culex pipiens pipiens]|uniref:Sec23/Sec24 trunk domain-containing protein n=1 Tax=Culex pipiens pipiens TaxID=38569 RepID=A0ABD1D5F0_CULPP
MLPTSFKYLRRVVNQSDSTLSIRQPTYAKRRNPARTELQANVARTAILLSPVYNELGQECVVADVSVDLFTMSNPYIDLATIGPG